LRAGASTWRCSQNKPVRIIQLIVDGLAYTITFFQVYGGQIVSTSRKTDPIGLEGKESAPAATVPLMVGRQLRGTFTPRRTPAFRCCGVPTYGFQPETLADPPPDPVGDRIWKNLSIWVLKQVRQQMIIVPAPTVPVSGILWCTVCKLPEAFTAGRRSRSARTCSAAACGKLVGRNRSPSSKMVRMDLSYPIGKLNLPESVTPEMRPQFDRGKSEAASAQFPRPRSRDLRTQQVKLDTPIAPAAGRSARWCPPRSPITTSTPYVRFPLAADRRRGPTIKSMTRTNGPKLFDARTAPVESRLQLIDRPHQRGGSDAVHVRCRFRGSVSITRTGRYASG